MTPMRNPKGQVDGLLLSDEDLHEALEILCHKRGYAYTGFQIVEHVVKVTVQPGVSWATNLRKDDGNDSG